MKRLEFRPEDFYAYDGKPDFSSENCARAQTLFDYWYKHNIESAPVVYGNLTGKTPTVWDTDKSGWPDGPRHKARLVCIEPIAPKECEHTKYVICAELDKAIRCYDCGKALRPKQGWEIVE